MARIKTPKTVAANILRTARNYNKDANSEKNYDNKVQTHE